MTAQWRRLEYRRIAAAARNQLALEHAVLNAQTVTR